MTPIQQLMLGVGAKKKTYLDDVFSTYLYKGTSTATARNNGINLSGEGGMVWVKRRDGSTGHRLTDTVRGVTKSLESDSNNAEATESTGIESFNSNGFTVGGDADYNATNDKYSSWTFRKAPGFFDVVTYTGNGTAGNTISHSLGCVPGMVVVKRRDSPDSWAVYHRGVGATKHLYLDSDNSAITSASSWNNTASTSSVITLGSDGRVNDNGGNYVAYIFAGGESTAATARSVRFDGSNDYLFLGASTDFDMGTGDFTIECWARRDGSTNNNVFTLGSYDKGLEIYIDTDNKIGVYGLNSSGGSEWIIPKNSNYLIMPGLWYHLALVRHSGTLKLYVNGIELGSTSHNYQVPATDENKDFFIGIEISSSDSIPGANPYFDGEISNVRVVKGTAVYTSSFRPPTAPLTNITNTKLLCCQNSTATGYTVSPGTIGDSSSPSAITDSPFDDPAAFTFGENGDQGLIKTSSYVGSGSSGLEINLGWEPQWVMLKDTTSASKNWMMLDCMRGIITDENDHILMANHLDDEDTAGRISLTSTGFKLNTANTHFNASGDTYIYLAIRRSDGYVGKPADAGTDVFTMDTGAGSSTIPNFDSGFPVDFAMYRKINAGDDWVTNTRLTAKRKVYVNNSDSEVGAAGSSYDSNVGYNKNSNADSDYQAWMWKRHAGFDVMTYTGDGQTDRDIQHTLSKIPDMVWVKRRDSSQNWGVYHKGANGGTNPHDYLLVLNANSAESYDPDYMLKEAPTSTSFKVANSNYTNANNGDYIAMLFASVDGISKVGSYTGTGSSFSVTCGFQPRFLIIRRIDSANDWRVFDTGRGWTSSDNNMMILNGTGTEDSGNYVNHNSTGFTLTTSADVNASSGKYVYYAHA